MSQDTDTPTTVPTIFNFETHPIDVYQDDDGEPWFVGRQVCDVLGLSHLRALARLDDDEKGMRIAHTPGGPQRMTVINEAGLFNLVLRSRKPETKRFRRWVTHEVLPAIRRTGAYSTLDAPPTRDVPEHILLRERRLADRELRLARKMEAGAILAAADDAEAAGGMDPRAIRAFRLMGLQKMTTTDLTPLLPPAPTGDDGLGWVTPTQIAKRLGVSVHRVGLTITALGLRGDKDRCMAVLNTAQRGAKTVTSYTYHPDVVTAVRERLLEDGHVVDGGAK